MNLNFVYRDGFLKLLDTSWVSGFDFVVVIPQDLAQRLAVGTGLQVTGI